MCGDENRPGLEGSFVGHMLSRLRVRGNFFSPFWVMTPNRDEDTFRATLDSIKANCGERWIGSH